MAGGVFLLKDDGNLEEMEEAPFQSEDVFQKLLAEFPTLLAGEQVNPAEPRRWLLVSREQPVPSEESLKARWSLDHLFLDQDGIPTLVEVKRQTDSRIRREVVGQMLDYAANAVVYWPAEEIRSRFTATCTQRNLDSSVVLAEFLGPDRNEGDYWNQVDLHLKAGRIRMLFVADAIPPELQRIVEFLNTQMKPAEVLAVEIRQFAGGRFKTLVPRVIGQTSEAVQRKSTVPRESRDWDEASFFQYMEDKRGKEEAALARKLYDWLAHHANQIVFGKGYKDGSFSGVFEISDGVVRLVRVWTDGTLEFLIPDISLPPFDEEPARRDLLSRLNAVAPFNLKETDKTQMRRIHAYLDGSSIRKLVGVFEWALGQMGNPSKSPST